MIMGGGGGGWRNIASSFRTGDLEDTIGGQVYDHKVVVRLAKYFLPYKPLVAMALIGILIYSGVTVAIPWMIHLAIDEYILPGNLTGLNYLVAVFVFLLLIHFIANYAHQVIISRCSQRVLKDIRNELFWYLQRQSMSFHNQYKVGQIMSRAQNDVQALNEFMLLMATAFADLMSLFGIVTAMFILSPLLAGVTLALIPLLVLALAIWQRFARSVFLRVRFAIARVNSALQENLTGIRVIQSMNRQQLNMSQFDELNGAHLDTQIRSTTLSAGVMPMVEIFTGLALAAIVIFGGKLVIQEQIKVGVLIAFALFVQRFYDPIRQLTMQYSQLQRAMAAGSRIFDMLDVPVALVDQINAKSLPPISGAIRYQAVQFGYVPGKLVLSDINLSIEPGETVALVGPTGAGKTTMVNLLARFFDVGSGSITVDNYDVRSITRVSLSTQMGVVLQEPFLFSGTIRENIRYSKQNATDHQLENAAKAVGIHDFIAGLPGQYDAVIGERGSNLSIGQRQLLSFARALVADPKILILDEATANIDTRTEQKIQEALARLLAGRTAIVIAHRLSTIRNADKIVYMEQGRIIEMGTHRSLMLQNGRYSKQYAQYQENAIKVNWDSKDT